MEKDRYYNTLKKINNDPAKFLAGVMGMGIGLYLGYKLMDSRIEYFTSLADKSLLENLAIKYEPLTKLTTSIIGGIVGYGSGLFLSFLDDRVMDCK